MDEQWSFVGNKSNQHYLFYILLISTNIVNQIGQ
ncbi:IS1 family transposase [Methylobacter tundripaludum]